MWWEIDANTSCAFWLACLIALHWLNKSSISQVIYFFESHTYSATRSPASFLPPGYYDLLSCIRITRLGSSSQSTMCWLIRAESSLALGKVFIIFWNSLFFKELFSGALRRSSRIYVYCLLKLKSTYPHWTYLFVCLVCLGVVLLFLVGNKWSSSTPSYISNSVNKGESICLNQSDRAYNRRGEFISGASKDQFSHRQSRHLRWHHYQ